MKDVNTTAKAFRPLFALGRVVATPGALSALQAAGQSHLPFISRHVSGDWGNLDAHDCAENVTAVYSGQRILSAYVTAKGTRLWIITEADRSVTILLLPSEY